MCSRITFEVTEEELTSAYVAEIGEDCIAKPVKKDIRITDEAWVITADEPERLQQMHFGLVPWDAPTCMMTRSTFNAKKENLLKSPLWSKLMNSHKRCIIITSGFTEPQHIDADRTKHWMFKLKERTVFSMAGLWSEWRDPQTGSAYRSFAIITNVANEQVAEVHTKNRMPVALTKEQEKLWLSKSLPNIKDYLDVLTTIPDDEMNRDQTYKPGANDDDSQLNLFE
ncbi:SOS response-associated peptidase [Mucilaginibacter kameinonensis]|uniref:SOS response-associated peptidase n=1 Tax=Mucilaginibacter kameinonensis TaxID=452286 RepID=UPI000EF759AF|nr:SOS response-associated peptidase [Mucilaginibacter kameinonensis]